jgi:cytidylate kinase
MVMTDFSFDSFIQEVVDKWGNSNNKNHLLPVSVVTISSEPGSGGQIIAKEIAEKMGFDLFQRNIIQEIAERADISTSVLDTIGKEHLSIIEDFIATLVNKKYQCPKFYIEQLMKIISVIGKHGHAVIVGRGANFILPHSQRLSIRVVASMDFRIRNISRIKSISEDDAKKEVITKEVKRKAFIRKSFDADIADPVNYDMIFNTEYIRYDAVVEMVRQILTSDAKSG